jgi:hypothetical protein
LGPPRQRRITKEQEERRRAEKDRLRQQEEHARNRKFWRMVESCPSPWWEEEIVYRRVRRMPPPADSTPMKLCRSGEACCKRKADGREIAGPKFYPATYVQTGICEDCRAVALLRREQRLRKEGLLTPINADRDRATSALGEMCMRGARLIEMKLPRTSETALRREIEHYGPAGRMVVIFDDGNVPAAERRGIAVS